MPAAHHHDHDHSPDHGGHAHSPGHAHLHAPASFGAAFAVGIVLNTGFVVAEGVFGLLSHSIALIADAGHNLSDVLGLLMAWLASVLARKAPSRKFTYGLGGSSILAALFNAVLLLVAVGAVAWEAIGRLAHPEPISALTVMAVAGAGILVNGITAMMFASGRKGDLNIRGAFLHMASDAVVSLGVVVAAAAILVTGWLWLDPVVSLVIVAAIVWGTWGLLRDSVGMSMAAVPPHVQAEAVQGFLVELPGTCAVHDLHIWPMSTTETALTAHLVMPEGHPGDAFLSQVASELHHRFRIGHATLQIETDPDFACRLEPDHVV